MGLDIKDLKLNQYHRSILNSGFRYLLQSESSTQQDFTSGTSGNSSPRLFPEPWQSIFQDTKPPIYCFFTYWELSYDLQYSSEKSAKRMHLFKNIISSLKWPEEKVVFWPATYINYTEFTLDADSFWEGVKKLQPVYLICFGKTVFSALFPERSFQVSQFTTTDNMNVLSLPGPNDMLPDNREAKRKVWHALKNLTISCPA